MVVAPGLAREVAAGIADDLLDGLRSRYGSVDWRIELAEDRLVTPPAPLTEIFDAARKKLLGRDWDLAVVVTDLPLRLDSRPATRHVSRTHAVALVSLPALGAMHLRRRLRRTLLELVGELIGDDDPQRPGRWEQRVLRELAADTEDPGRLRFLFVPAVLFGHLRLLLGMVRANRPWRLVARLDRALAAALAAGAYGVVVSDIWRISAAMGWWRLAVSSVLSIAVTVILIIVAHELWERAPDPRVREQVVLFNVATAATVGVGILALYVALFALVLAGAGLVITPGLLSDALGRDVGLGDYATLAWFVTSLATIGGALGAVLESDQAVREAAYASSEPDEGLAAERR